MNEPVECSFYQQLEDGTAHCRLCPHNCLIAEGETGICQVRRNVGGKLIAESFGHPAAVAVDPIEKKPFGWFRPGTKTFSVGTFGCNLGCRFCQNDSLSRRGCGGNQPAQYLAPRRIIELAIEHGCETIAFTYNEPTVFIEYAMATAHLARIAGLGTVLVSNGYINPEPRAEFYPLIDAANIDLKGNGDFYRELCGGKLEPVLESCVYFKQECNGHLELTTLVIPGCNDRDEMVEALLDCVAERLGADTPMHFSAYFPAGGFTAPPTPATTLYRIRELALAKGFTRIKLGNIKE